MLGISSPKLPSRQVQMHKSFRFGNIFLNSHNCSSLTNTDYKKKDFGLFHFYEFSKKFFSLVLVVKKPKNFQGQKASSDPDPLLLPFCQKASFEKFIHHAYASYAHFKAARMMTFKSHFILDK